MPRFNLDDYETVESRIKRFYADYPDGRITTEWVNNTTWADVVPEGPKNWVVKACVYLTAGDQANSLPKATGFAQETDGTGGANNVDALANAETSSIGRALANMAMSGNKRASREEMQKVNHVTERNWVAEADSITNIAGLRWLYAQAKSAGVSPEQLERIEARGKELGASSEGEGADGSVPKSGKS